MNKVQADVSIIIPALNAQDVVARAVECALGQTVRNVQVVVVDDGSTDETAQIVRELADADRRITLVSHERNRGRLEARRSGIQAATGRFTLFLDADDELAPNTAERLLAEQAGRFDIVQCDFRIVYRAFAPADERRFNRDFNRPPATTAEGDDITHLVFRDRRTTWSLCGKLMRTSLVKQAIAHIPEGSLSQAEDACLFFVISCLASTYKGVPGFAGYTYNIDEGTSDARWKAMSAHQFSYSCRYVHAMDLIGDFLLRTGRLSDLAQDYDTVRREHARAVADKLLHVVNRAERPAAFQEFARLWPADEVASSLAEASWDNAGDCWADIAKSPALACQPRPVRTVGAYHWGMGVGGAERVAATLARLWCEKGYKVVFFCDEPRSACVQDLPDGLEWVTLPSGNDATPESYRQRAYTLRCAVQRHQVDAFVQHQWWSPVAAWDLLLLKTLGVPVCLMCHSIFEMLLLEGRPAEFDAARVFRHAEGIVALSDADCTFWREFNPRVWQANNPLTITPDRTALAPLDGQDVIWVGRLSGFDKQPAEALHIMARVIAHNPAATLTMVGTSTDPRDLRSLQALASQLGIERNVRFVGAQPDLVPYYRAASVHLLTSRLEGWCLVLAESKALGIPCVMYEMPYLTLTQGNRGIVAVEQGNRDAAARAIADLLEDAPLRRSLGADAFDHLCEIGSFDLGALWEEAFGELARGSVDRAGFEARDRQWDLVVDGMREAVRSASDPGIRAYAKRKGYEAARSLRHRIRRS